MKRIEYLINGRPYAVEILAFNGSTAQVRVNGRDYRVEIQQPLSAAPTPEATAVRAIVAPPQAASTPPTPLAVAPAPKPLATTAAPLPQTRTEELMTGDVVCAPMPGIILSVLVDEGQLVAAGDPLLVLEAMKMENEIHAPRAGTIKKILVRDGTDVRQGSPLIELA